MRESFQNQLAALEDRVTTSLGLAIGALEDVSRCVAHPSVPTPPTIEGSAGQLRNAYRDVCDEIVSTLARQAPVARDLRLTLALIEIAHHTGLIANQFELISAQLEETDPQVADHLGTGKTVALMADLAVGLLAGAATAVTRRDSDVAARVAAEDLTINVLNREVFATTVAAGHDEIAREVSMRHVLIARSLERIGDNAVDIAEQAMFLVTGEPHEFTDASRPDPAAGRRMGRM